MSVLGLGPGSGGRLGDWGVKKEDLPFMAEKALTAGRSDNNPVKTDETWVLYMLEEIL